MNIDEAIEQKGELWVIAALVDGSIGYHTPSHARRIVENWKKGERKDYCERCMALYGCDLQKMMQEDINKLEWTENNNPEKAERLLKAMEHFAKLDDETQTSLSMMYPTMNI